ncbi:MAG: energy transducer TonB, partial [Candidatus Acidiferrales bacterium]
CEADLNGGGELLHLKAVSGNIVLKLGEPPSRIAAASPAGWPASRIEGEDPSLVQVTSSDDPEDDFDADGFLAEVRRMVLESWWGGVPVDSGEMQRHVEHSVAPAYPEVARKAGIDGNVALRVSVSSEGRVTNVKVLDGPSILARAAVDAVEQWKYRPVWVDGRPAAVVTTIVISFRLH